MKAKEQAQELKSQLRPLKEEIQKLMLQRACLEEKLKLIHIHWREDVGQYKVSKTMWRRVFKMGKVEGKTKLGEQTVPKLYISKTVSFDTHST